MQICKYILVVAKQIDTSTTASISDLLPFSKESKKWHPSQTLGIERLLRTRWIQKDILRACPTFASSNTSFELNILENVGQPPN